jgi:hypothetical protein
MCLTESDVTAILICLFRSKETGISCILQELRCSTKQGSVSLNWLCPISLHSESLQTTYISFDLFQDKHVVTETVLPAKFQRNSLYLTATNTSSY